jgi:ElaB/YqjD/DUF883 family membrane-anchored ribosome-binding protein
MTVSQSSQKLTSDQKKWQQAIEDTKRRLKETKVQRDKLRAAVRIFEERLISASPWPGGKAGTAA